MKAKTMMESPSVLPLDQHGLVLKETTLMMRYDERSNKISTLVVKNQALF